MQKAIALENFWISWFNRPQAKAKNFQAAVREKSGARFYFAVGLIAFNAILLMSYVYGVNQYATAGYEIRTLQKKVSSLTEDNRKVSFKVSEAGSMVSIQTDFLNSNFVAAGTPTFLQAGQFTMK